MIRSLAHGSAHFSTFFFFNDTATTEIYTLSLHDALPIFEWVLLQRAYKVPQMHQSYSHLLARHKRAHVVVKARSEEHTSELQSRSDLVCRLLLEKKKKKTRRSARVTGLPHEDKFQG